jgi:DNA-binding winged helix-turn-helix (wHTH) protein/tetratricopeptide (TPR) repeat protein
VSRTILRFADCTLDVAARALTRGGERVDLPPIVFDCIAYLATHRERAVGRDELVAAVWGKSAISDTMLGKAILAARRAIGDSAEAQALIRTIPRFGYHWIGAVSGETLDAADVSPPPPSQINRPRARYVLGACAAAIAVVAISLATYRYATKPAPPAENMRAVIGDVSVVLPVDVVAGADDAWLRLGLMDLIANRLRAADLPVMSSDSVVGLLKQNGETTTELVQALRRANPSMRTIEVSVAKAGRDWTLHAQVTDGKGAPRSVDARAADAVAVARAGSDGLLELFGRQVPGGAARNPRELPLDVLMQRTEAARLADDLDAARSLLESAPPELSALPEVRLRRAQIELRAGRFDDAASRLEALLAEVTAESDPVQRARILVALCNIQGRLDRQSEAIATCGDAITLAGAHDATEPLALAYNNRAITHARQRDFTAAEADFARARIAFERSGDMLALVRLDGNEASAAMGRGRPAEALPIFERAGRRFDQLGIPSESLIAVTNQIDAQRQLLESAKALAASERGWALLPRVEDRNLQHHFKRQRAEALAVNGRLIEAHALLDELIGDIDAEHESATLAMTRASQAALERDSGQAEIAAVLAEQAIAALADPEYEQPRAAAWLTQIRALRRLGRANAATDALARLAAWADRSKRPIVVAYAELAAAEQVDAGNAAADEHFERASAVAADLNLPYLIQTVAVAYGEALIVRGELERAAIVSGRVARYAEIDFESALLQARLYHALGQTDAWRTAVARSRRLAGERTLPAAVAAPPARAAAASGAKANTLRTAA